MDNLSGKVALITGGSRGIGRGIALELAQNGASLAISYVAHADQAAATIEAITQYPVDAIAIQSDSSDVSQVKDLVRQVHQHYGHIDILVSNAGIEYFGALDEITDEAFDRVFAVNTRGQFFVVQQVARYMKPGGRIVCSSSMSATIPFARHAVYAASKAAVEAMVKNLAIELGPRGITINAIAPGGVGTDMAMENASEYLRAFPGMTLEDLVKIMMPTGRLGTPKDVAQFVAYLVSPAAEWITGQTMHIDGGVH